MMRIGLMVALVMSGARAQTTPSAYAWVQMVSGGAEVRAIVARGSVCPIVKADGKALAMRKRAEPVDAKTDFPDTCQTLLPIVAKRLTVDGRTMALPNPDPQRILVIGDTGCRMDASQDCTTDWPFGKIAGLAAQTKPDLIVHVGDYYYREACPGGETHCENWQNWRTDFFDPARPLLAAAPWIFARGNHEACAQAAEGWFRYLDAGTAPLPCPNAKAAAFLVPLNGLNLAVIDSSDLPDAWRGDRKLESFAAEIDSTHPAADVPQWVVTHKPPFVQGYMNPATDGNSIEYDPSLPNLQMILAGHLHLFGSFNFGAARPAQLIVGDGGTRLMVTASKMDKDSADPNALLQQHAKVDGQVADFTVKGRFGYFLLERASSSATWKGTLYGVDNKPMVTATGQGGNSAASLFMVSSVR